MSTHRLSHVTAFYMKILAKINTLEVWPHVHVCLLDLECWRGVHDYGMPLRVYWRGGFWDIFGVQWISDRRTETLGYYLPKVAAADTLPQ